MLSTWQGTTTEEITQFEADFDEDIVGVFDEDTPVVAEVNSTLGCCGLKSRPQVVPEVQAPKSSKKKKVASSCSSSPLSWHPVTGSQGKVRSSCSRVQGRGGAQLSATLVNVVGQRGD